MLRIVYEENKKTLVITVYPCRREIQMKLKYDREGDVLDILVTDKQVHHAEEYD